MTSSIADYFRKPVSGSEDLNRILALPRRTVNPKDYVQTVTKALRKPGPVHSGGPSELLPIQALALYELSRYGGLLGPIGVGHGKTGLDVLAPMVLPACRRVVLLLPSALRNQFSVNYREWAVNFRVPNLAGERNFDASLPTITLVSYDQLSRESGTVLLDSLAPDFIIADEAHALRHKVSARTKRVLRYFSARPNTRFAGWSGTLTSRSIKDYAHLSTLALRKNSPLPLHWATVEEWAAAIDANVSGIPAEPGALERLAENGEDVRSAFRRRLVQTAGVVATEESAIGTSLYFLERKIETPETVTKALQGLRSTWTRPDGEELVEAIQFYRCARELASGFYYRWRFPRGEDRRTIDRWLETRKLWHKELRGKLSQAKPHLDSPLLCTKAAIRHEDGYRGPLPTWESEHWPQWREIRNTVKPETEAVWISDYLIQDICKSVDDKPIVWYEHDAFARKLKSAGIPCFGAGDVAISDEKGDRAIGASIFAHGTGKNLQMFASNLIANYPSSLSAWEQLLGRTHRPGQTADEVLVTVYRQTPELRAALKKAREYARYQQQTLGGAQKLLYSAYTFDPDDDAH